MSPRDKTFVLRVGVLTLAICTISIIWAFLGGLFNPLVDNGKIFEILAPVTHEITGGLIAILAAMVAVGRSGKEKDTEE